MISMSSFFIKIGEVRFVLQTYIKQQLFATGQRDLTFIYKPCGGILTAYPVLKIAHLCIPQPFLVFQVAFIGKIGYL